MSREYNLEPPVQRGDHMVIRDPRLTMVFRPGSRKLLFNGTLVLMNRPLTAAGPAASVSPADLAGTLDPLLRPRDLIRRTGARRVLLDPGHGGGDPGAGQGPGMKEKAMTLDLVLRCKRLLEAQGVEVHLTRDRDQALSLADRAALARRLDADLLVSVHINSSRNTAATGVETHILPAAGAPCTAPSTLPDAAVPGNRHDAMNTLLGYSVQRSVLQATQAPDRGLRRSRYQVLRDAPCPAILVECGFISHHGEAQQLARQDYRQDIAKGLARGIRDVLAK